MASNSEKVDQDANPPCFNLGDLVRRRWQNTIWLAVICPDFGSNGQYTKVEKVHSTSTLFGSLSYRYYHVQRLGQRFDQAWVSEIDLDIIRNDHVKDMDD